jgi:hypothetical protein
MSSSSVVRSICTSASPACRSDSGPAKALFLCKVMTSRLLERAQKPTSIAEADVPEPAPEAELFLVLELTQNVPAET